MLRQPLTLMVWVSVDLSAGCCQGVHTAAQLVARMQVLQDCGQEVTWQLGPALWWWCWLLLLWCFSRGQHCDQEVCWQVVPALWWWWLVLWCLARALHAVEVAVVTDCVYCCCWLVLSGVAGRMCVA